MARKTAPHSVRCYYCRRQFEVGARAESTACPGCGKAIIVGDVLVKQLKPVTTVRTCGRVVVHRKGRIIARDVEAHGGVEVMGILDANVVSGGPVVIGPKAQWNGDCNAPSVVIKQGAQVNGQFVVPDPSVVRIAAPKPDEASATGDEAPTQGEATDRSGTRAAPAAGASKVIGAGRSPTQANVPGRRGGTA
ncbi:MAG: hypothetical protein CMJ18_19960 [Phycisphaeraceae bacterium]|nr:hypothetical protein [Phycisphaeraceae bacterium]